MFTAISGDRPSPRARFMPRDVSPTTPPAIPKDLALWLAWAVPVIRQFAFGYLFVENSTMGGN